MILENDASSYKSTTASAEGYQDASGGKHNKTYANIDTEIMHNPTNTDIDILIRNCKRQNLTNDRYKYSYGEEFCYYLCKHLSNFVRFELRLRSF
jgi:hypothetical protein